MLQAPSAGALGLAHRDVQGVGVGVVLVLEPSVDEAEPLQLPAPQLDAPVDAVPSVDVVSVVAVLSPLVVELVELSVVDELPEPLLPPPQAERPRSAVAATASVVLMFLFILEISLYRFWFGIDTVPLPKRLAS